MRYSRDPLLNDPLARITAGGVGGLIVGAGPTDDVLIDVLELLEIGWRTIRGVLRTPWPISSRAANILITNVNLHFNEK